MHNSWFHLVEEKVQIWAKGVLALYGDVAIPENVWNYSASFKNATVMKFVNDHVALFSVLIGSSFYKVT